MDFEIPADIKAYLGVLDAFIESDIKPLQAKDDNERFFDHRREHARALEEALKLEMAPAFREAPLVNFRQCFRVSAPDWVDMVFVAAH
jgi:7-cyano-7-deazaguanine synthase in queuosine biosynthesis